MKLVNNAFHGKLLFTTAILMLMLSTAKISAQHGHPLVGSWSGNWTDAQGQSVRLLILLDFSEDQVISGTIIENTARMAIQSAVLDPSDWSLVIKASRRDGEGQSVDYEVLGKIENLGSARERAIAGTWKRGGESGPFRVVIN